MSTAMVTYPIVAAVKGAEAMIGPDREWKPVNRDQATFLEKYFGPCRGEVDALKEIETKASWHADKLNAFLKTKGFSITLNPFKEGEFGVASVLDLLVEWLSPGAKVRIKARGKEYPGVRLEHGVQFFSAYRGTSVTPSAVARLETKSGDMVYVMPTEKTPKNFGLVDLVNDIARTLTPTYDYDAVQFPMVDLNYENDISWLTGMSTVGGLGQGHKIAQAKQQTKLRMNEKGARAQSAVAIGVVATAVLRPKPDLIINRSFLVWFTRPGLAQPLFVGYITPEDWKEPADLETP